MHLGLTRGPANGPTDPFVQGEVQPDPTSAPMLGPTFGSVVIYQV